MIDYSRTCSPGAVPGGISAARDVIEADPARGLTLAELAFYAMLSPGHFQRRFRSEVGETPHSYARRLRLERAAFRLRHENLRILDIALDAGYETHESFTRAFQGLFGHSPQSFRERRPARETARPPCVESVRIERFAGLSLRYQRIVGPYEALAERDLFERRRALSGPPGARPENRRDAPLIGICNDDPEITPASRLRFDLGLGCADGDRTLPAGVYAVARHTGPYQKLNDTYRYLIDTYPRLVGRTPGTGPCFEIYRFTGGNPGVIDVYAPLSGQRP
jgi:AraC family transcriptional regulator